MTDFAEKNNQRAFRALDLALYGCVLLLAAASFFCFFPFNRTTLTGVSGKINGNSVFFYAFDDETLTVFSDTATATETTDKILITLLFGEEKSVIVIEKSKRIAYVAQTDCPHKDCTHTTVAQVGNAVVCLPYRLTVEGTGEGIPAPGVG